MSRPKAKQTTMADKKLAKLKEENATLRQQVTAARMQVLNIRQMYEATIQEKGALQQQLAQRTQLIVGMIAQSRGNKFTLKEKTFDKLAEFVGYNANVEDGDLTLTLIEAEVEPEPEEDDE